MRKGRHLQANARRRRASEHKVHKRLRIVGGAMAGKLLLSGRGETTRPMMEKVGHKQRVLTDKCAPYSSHSA